MNLTLDDLTNDTFDPDVEPVCGFFADFYWLSNFCRTPILYEGMTYPTVEHAYQAAKVVDPFAREPFLVGSATAAKLRGNRVQLRPHWDQLRLGIMLDLTRIKYRGEFRSRLLATGNRYLEETNWWGDSYWGVFDGKGENHLGRIIMRVRAEIRSGTTTVR